jgi:hypothetical protein
MSDSHTASGSDTKAAFTGLILGAIVIFCILYSIVRITNAGYAAEKPAAEAAK